jgi:GNAT superfamily N-acetyltransferase
MTVGLNCSVSLHQDADDASFDHRALHSWLCAETRDQGRGFGWSAVSHLNEGVDALLMDGRIVHVRPVSEGDRDALSALYGRASPRTRYLRFFSAGISIDREVRRLMPGDDHVALLAEHDGLVVGVASYEVLSGDHAEMAILVDDAWQGDGIGSLLIEHLAAAARRRAFNVLATNVSMLRTAEGLAPGIARQHGDDPGVVHIQIPTQPDERALAAAGAPHGRTQFATSAAGTCLAGRHWCQPFSERRWL